MSATDQPARSTAGREGWPQAESYEPTSEWLRRQWRRWRALLAVAVLVLAVGIGYGLATTGGSAARFDPSSPRPDGSRAAATLLEQRGVRLQHVQQFSDAIAKLDAPGDRTVVLAAPERLGRERADRLRTRAARSDTDLVLLEPNEQALRSLAPGVHPAGDAFENVRHPGCGWRAAQRAGSITTTGPLYRASAANENTDSDVGDEQAGNRSWRSCYSDGTRSAVLRSGRVTVLGAASILQNNRLDEQGNAALSLNLLGQNEQLVWYLPSVSDVPEEQQPGLGALLPPQVKAALGVLAVTLVLVALAAARRLGPVVTEPLPVRVPAAETTLGRARLYRRAHARASAASTLREATRHRLALRLGLPTSQNAQAIAAAVAERTDRSESEVADILTGAAPSDDNGLVELADALDRLEQEVSRT